MPGESVKTVNQAFLMWPTGAAAAVGLFVVGGTVSVWRGVSELVSGADGAENYRVAYAVLTIAEPPPADL